MNSGIYSISSPSGKRYVGSSKNIKARWAQHRTDLRRGVHHSKQLQLAAKKYGVAALEFNVLLLCNQDKLIELEQMAIDELRPEYNGTKTAVWNPGRLASPETREKMRRVFSPETKKKLSEARKNRQPQSDETKQKISASLIGRKKTQESITKKLATEAENPRVRSHKKSGLPVGITAKRHRFWARATVNGVRVVIGTYATVGEAVEARASFLMGAK